MYKDTHKEAEKHIVQSDKSRASYYEIIANKNGEIKKTMIFVLTVLLEMRR